MKSGEFHSIRQASNDSYVYSNMCMVIYFEYGESHN